MIIFSPGCTWSQQLVPLVEGKVKGGKIEESDSETDLTSWSLYLGVSLGDV